MNIDVTALKAVERERGIPADTVLAAIRPKSVGVSSHSRTTSPSGPSS